FVLINDRAWEWCTVVFAAAAVTDYLDGYFARRQGLTSSLGRVLDPLVDKVLICGAYIFLLPLGKEEGWLHPWMVTVVVARELVINSLRSFLENRGVEFGADWLGKFKMGLQCAALFGVFVALYFRAQDEYSSLTEFFAAVRTGLIYAMLAATVLSGLQYLWRATMLLKQDHRGDE